MAFFDNFGKKVSEIAGNAADKAKDLGEIAKLKAEILKKQNQANSELLDLGRKVYEEGKSNPEGAYSAECASISACYTAVDDLRARIALVKSNDDTPVEVEVEAEETQKVCPVCGELVSEDAKFCSKCGAAL